MRMSRHQAFERSDDTMAATWKFDCIQGSALLLASRAHVRAADVLGRELNRTIGGVCAGEEEASAVPQRIYIRLLLLGVLRRAREIEHNRGLGAHDPGIVPRGND